MNTRKLVLSAMFLAMALTLPFLTGQIPQVGAMLSPMHIPVLLCGFVCGPIAGFAVGLVAPLLRYALFGMPPIVPTGAAMALELAAYGLVSGWLIRLLPRKTGYLYLALVVSMLAGRAVWGAASALILAARGGAFSQRAFLAGAFLNAWPGILCQLALIPPLVRALSPDWRK